MERPDRQPDERKILATDWTAGTRRTVERWFVDGVRDVEIETTEPVPADELLAKLDELQGSTGPCR